MAGEVRTRIVIDADSRQAVRALDQVGDAAADADKTVQQLSGESVKLDTSPATSALGDLRSAASKPITVDVNIDQEKLQRVRDTGDGIRDMGDRANALQSGVGPLRGFTDELGGTAGAAGTAANAFIDAGEAAQIFGEQLGVSQATLGKLAAGLGALGVGVAVGTLLWSKYQGSIKAAREEAERLEKQGADTLQALNDQKYVEAAQKLREEYADIFDVFQREGVPAGEVVRYLTGEIDELTTSAGGIIASFQLRDLRTSFNALTEDTNAETLAVQYLADGMKAAGGAGELALTDISDAAEEAKRDTDLVAAAFDRLSGQIDADRAAINLAAQFDAVRDAAFTAYTDAASGAAGAEKSQRDYQLQVLSLKDSIIDYAGVVDGLDPTLVTTLLSEVDQMSLDSAESTINQVARDRPVGLKLFAELMGVKQTPIPQYVAAPRPQGRQFTQNVTVNATGVGMREVDAATTRWLRVNGG